MAAWPNTRQKQKAPVSHRLPHPQALSSTEYGTEILVCGRKRPRYGIEGETVAGEVGGPAVPLPSDDGASRPAHMLGARTWPAMIGAFSPGPTVHSTIAAPLPSTFSTPLRPLVRGSFLEPRLSRLLDRTGLEEIGSARRGLGALSVSHSSPAPGSVAPLGSGQCVWSQPRHGAGRSWTQEGDGHGISSPL